MASNIHSELAALLHHSGFALRNDRAFLRVTGEDATRWLNGMVTNAVGALAPGEGNYNFLLNAQGRIQGDCFVFREPSLTSATEPTSFLIATDGVQVGPLQAHLERFIIMDDVELTTAFPEETTLVLVGPEAPGHLTRLQLPALDPLHLAYAETPHGAVRLLALPHKLVPRFELRAAAAVTDALEKELRQAAIMEVSPETLEQLRVLEGTPRFGVDIRDRELPQETNQMQALHFAKGCYLGQEIVERIRSRGQVHRSFTGFRLEGSLPMLPAILEANGKAAGELTSTAVLILEDGPALLALGYCRREVLDSHTPLSYPGGTAYPRSLPRVS